MTNIIFFVTVALVRVARYLSTINLNLKSPRLLGTLGKTHTSLSVSTTSAGVSHG